MERVLEVLAINRAIAGALTRDEILQRVVSSTLVWSEATACVLLLRDEQGQARLGAAAGELPDGFADFSVPLDEHIVDALRRRVDAGDQDGFFGAPIVQAGALIG
ncbi:MAG: hypothetical protein FJX77_10810, partial [Armatimonadetes bacterium]|nr:hypothetical protein [Armatimonadota bacterium]